MEKTFTFYDATKNPEDILEVLDSLIAECYYESLEALNKHAIILSGESPYKITLTVKVEKP